MCVGRSPLVGKPVGLMLLNRNVDRYVLPLSHYVDLAAQTRQADLLIVAIGRPAFITADMVKPGATVIDVGINHRDGRAVGDVKFEEVKDVAGFITPVPGGCRSDDACDVIRKYFEISDWRLT